jgi:hypothetical protein
MTVLTSAPTLRLLRAPAIDPPYDDEVGDQTTLVDGSLALAFPPGDAPRIPLRLVPPAAATLDDDVDGPRPTSRADLPDPRPWTRRLAQAVVEILAGARPAAQLARYATLDVLDALEHSTGRLARGADGRVALRPIVASVHVSEPADGVAEACAVVDTGPRRRALAFRLEGLDGRWQCTELQLG